ncbi:ob-fold nucleic acid [Fusarium longipes]|uniref:CST complex subunit STN1 n=1 Tax=Fusarium longipes TaxID=694270 RepID=A0A395SEJ9_9HYPO|nr:ob-fold nucleic acid [Fusarium longipes]
MSEPDKPQVYPRYCFHLAPTVNQWCPFRATDVHGLDHHTGFEGENFYFYRNLPIKWVRIVGIVVAIDEFTGRRVYTIDDSSGVCIECTVAIPIFSGGDGDTAATGGAAPKRAEANLPLSTDPFPTIDVGCVVDVKGGLSTFRDERQLTIEKMVAVRSTQQEVALWEKRVRFQSEVLDKPWVLRKSEIRRCRHEAERSEEAAERKQRRMKAIARSRSDKQISRSAEQSEDRAKLEPSKETRLDLRQIIEKGGRGKYNALGL